MIPHNMRYLLPTVYGGAERYVPRNNKQPYLRNLANPNNPNTTEPTDNLTAECVSRKSDGKLREPPNFDRGKNYFCITFTARKHLRPMLFLRVNTLAVPNSPIECNFICKFRIIVSHNTQHTRSRKVRKSDIRMRKFPVVVRRRRPFVADGDTTTHALGCVMLSKSTRWCACCMTVQNTEV